MKDKVLIIVGSNSVHSIRYLTAVYQNFEQTVFITNNTHNLNLPTSIITYCINFKLLNFKARYQIANILKLYPNGIIHIHQANSFAYHTIKAVKLTKLKFKIILTTWGSDILILPNRNKLMYKMVNYNISQADIITSDSLYMSSEIRHIYPKVKRLITLNFGIQNFESNLDLSKKEDVILSNRLHKPLYNIDKILIGFKQFINTYPKYNHYKLYIIASGSETDKLIKLSHELGFDNNQIKFLGMLNYNELIKYYKISKLFISIPSSDAGSLSVAEAMSYGCYPILSNIPANLELVINQINGTIVESEHNLGNDIYQALELINNNDKYYYITSFNHQIIAQKYVFQTNIQDFIKLYHEEYLSSTIK